MKTSERIETSYRMDVVPGARPQCYEIRVSIAGIEDPNESPMARGLIEHIDTCLKKDVAAYERDVTDLYFLGSRHWDAAWSEQSGRRPGSVGSGGTTSATQRRLREMAMEQRFYEANLSKLLRDYEGQCIALYRGRVIAFGKDPRVVHREAHALVRRQGGGIKVGMSPAILVRKCERGRDALEKRHVLPAVLRGTFK